MKRRAAVAAAAVLFAVSGVSAGDGLDALAGKALFERLWVPAPASTDAADGLGPLFNARSCTGCHRRGGGAEFVRTSQGRQDIAGAIVRLGDRTGAIDAFYGAQLQSYAVPGLQAEARLRFGAKRQVELLGPPLAAGIAMSVRLAPSLHGRAALALIPDEEILKHADPDDRNGDGISGRARKVTAGLSSHIGRFGWKAAQASLEEQVAHAFMLDLGLSSPLFPKPHGDCTALERDCRAAPTGESPTFEGRELSSLMISLVVDYLATLKAPGPRAGAAGQDLFIKTGCAACHIPAMPSANGTPIPLFSDLLLHDMGPELDDGVGEVGAGSPEWRTAPLIGLGNGTRKRVYLHDGRAATLNAAILAHGGEAKTSKQAFRALDGAAKRRLIAYLNGL